MASPHRNKSTLSIHRGIAVLLVALTTTLLASCGGKSISYRYKLTLELDTPSGVKRGSSVIEFTTYEGNRAPWTTNGEAVYVDLGPGRRPLIALLSKSRPNPSDDWPQADVLARAYGEPPHGQAPNTDEQFFAFVSRVSRHRGAKEIRPEDLPDLVTFRDIKDPRTVEKVDPNNLEDTLGPGTAWRRITVEVVDRGRWPLDVLGLSGEPVTSGIETRLLWLNNLDQYRTDPKNPFSNTLPREISALRSK